MNNTTSHSTASPVLIITIGFLVLTLAFGTRALIGLGMPTWMPELGWSRTEVSAMGALALVMMAVFVPISGYASDRLGPRGVLAIGCLALGVGLLITAGMEQLWQLGLGYGLGSGIGFGLASLPVVGSLVVRRVSRRQGLATGITTAGATAGPLLVLPLMAWLFGLLGWRSAVFSLGVVCLLTAVLVYWLVDSERPRNMAEQTGVKKPGPGAQIKALSRSRAFHGLFWSFTLCGFTSTGVVETHLIPFAQFCGFPPLPSTLAYSVFAAFNLIGMVGAGYLCDRVDRRNLLMGIYLLRAAAFILPLYIGMQYPLLIGFAVLVGLAFYATFPATIGLAAAHFGKEHLGFVMGLLSVGHALGAAAGAFASGYVFDLFMRYDWTWGMSILLAASSAGFVLLLRDPRSAERISESRLSASP